MRKPSDLPARWMLGLLWILLAASPARGGPACDPRDRVPLEVEGRPERAGDYGRMLCGIRALLRERTGLDLDVPVRLRIVTDHRSFRRMSGHDSIVAFAVPGENLMVIDEIRLQRHPLEFGLTLRHEAAHILLHRHIPRENLPRWFDEGVAQWVSDGMKDIIHPEAADPLKRAVVARRLIPLHRLRTAFPVDPGALALAYEQAASVIAFIEKRHGEAAVRGLLARLAGGEPFGDAFRAELGVAPHALETSWAEHLRRRQTWAVLLADHVYSLVFLLGALVLLAGFVRVLYRIRTYPEDEEEAAAAAEEGEEEG